MQEDLDADGNEIFSRNSNQGSLNIEMKDPETEKEPTQSPITDAKQMVNLVNQEDTEEESARNKSPSFSMDEFGQDQTPFFLQAKISNNETTSNSDLVLLVQDI